MSDLSYYLKCKKTGDVYYSDTLVWIPAKPRTRHQKQLWRRSMSRQMRRAYARQKVENQNIKDVPKKGVLKYHYIVLPTAPWRETGVFVDIEAYKDFEDRLAEKKFFQGTDP